MLALRRKKGEWIQISGPNGVTARVTYRPKASSPCLELGAGGEDISEGEEGTLFGGAVIVKHLYPQTDADVNGAVIRVGFVCGKEYVIARGELLNRDGGFNLDRAKEARQPLVPNRSSRSHRRPPPDGL